MVRRIENASARPPHPQEDSPAEDWPEDGCLDSGWTPSKLSDFIGVHAADFCTVRWWHLGHGPEGQHRNQSCQITSNQLDGLLPHPLLPTYVVRQPNRSRTASRALGHARSFVLFEPMFNGPYHDHGGRSHRMAGLGGDKRSRLITPAKSSHVVLIQHPDVRQFAVSTIVIKPVADHKAVWNFKANKISFNHRRSLALFSQ